jgi:microcystin degradation protein MlrC
MRVGIIALLHESNTFVAERTTLDHFRENWLFTAATVRTRLADAPHEVGGFLAGLAAERIDAVPLLAARAVPFGPISADCFEALLEIMRTELSAAGPLDGILVAPHGATVSERFPDADGHWLAELRQLVGPELPIIGTLDAHANLSQKMIDATNALIAYRTNPHLDQRDRGLEAATMLAAVLRGEISPTQAAAFPPVAINIERQLTSDQHFQPFYQLADRLRDQEQVLSNSILLGFPYADVAEMGSSTIVVTDGNAELARQSANALSEYLWTHRADFAGQLLEIETALDQVANLPGPICLLDMGDNVGGGSPADGTHLAHAMAARGMGGAFVCLYDPAAVRQAASHAVGDRFEMAVGGQTDRLHGEPFSARFILRGLFDGRFHEPETRHGGFSDCDQGPTAVVQTDQGMTFMLTSRRMPPFSLHQLTSFDVDPTQFHVLVAKGVNAPVAAYEPVCRHLLRVNTPGCTTADMTTLNFEHRRRPLFPFEADFSWKP